MLSVLLALAIQASAAAGAGTDTLAAPPPIAREFRGLWVASVDNIDWPSTRGLTTEQQKAELLALLDRMASIHMNAMILQIRPEADALYASKLEPWSRYLTGVQGRAPSPKWDPLAFAITEAHKRGIELHAWFNPYRAAFKRAAPNAASHVANRHPRWIRSYYDYLWMDPALPEVRQRMIDVVLDVVRRYDVDAVHIDDYFYPYPEVDARTKRTIPFPDSRTYAAYRKGGGKLSLADWRRRNVDVLIKQFYSAVKAEKKWVKVGISPFGIWRPGNPPSIQAGIDTYDELYADARKWLREGWLDYMTPQIYWPVSPPEQSYPVILQWWVDENVKGRHVWPGLALYKIPVTGPKHMSSTDIVQEILLTRQNPGASGHVHYNARVLMDNLDAISDRLAPVYGQPALVPASPWLDSDPPSAPKVAFKSNGAERSISIAPRDEQYVAWWAVQLRVADSWQTVILPGTERSFILNGNAAPGMAAVSAVDRAGNISAPSILRLQ